MSYAHLRYFLGGYRPSQTTTFTYFFLKSFKEIKIAGKKKNSF